MSENFLSVQAAANRVGFTEFGLRKSIDRGELRAVPGTLPIKLDPADVERFISARRTAAIQRITARGTDLVQLARDVRMFLRPLPGAPSSGGVSKVGAEVMALFGPAALNAAAIRDPGVCGWCATTVASRMLGTEMPAYSAAYVELLGNPCAKDRAVLDAELDRLRREVNAGARRPSVARAAPVVAPRPASPRPSSPAAVQRPVQASRGPLPAQTAAASWRATTAAATRPPGWPYFVGNKACGTPVGQACACHPPRAVTASAKPKPKPKKATPTTMPGAKRAGVHSCGCTCTRCMETTR
jgi:hypothetical protein